MPVAQVENGKIINNGEAANSKMQTSSLSKSVEKSKLDYDSFLQLLCAEMQYQDPLEPTTNTDYVAQLATFSQLEATLSMQNTTTTNMANNLVGKIVLIDSETETGTDSVEGVVDYVKYVNDTTYVSVNDKLYKLDDVKQVVDPTYYEAVSLAETLAANIADLPDVANLTPAYKSKIESIRKVYDGMTAYQKTFVAPEALAKLTTLEELASKFNTQPADSTASETDGTTNTDAAANTDATTDTANTTTDTTNTSNTEENNDANGNNTATT